MDIVVIDKEGQGLRISDLSIVELQGGADSLRRRLSCLWVCWPSLLDNRSLSPPLARCPAFTHDWTQQS